MMGESIAERINPVEPNDTTSAGALALGSSAQLELKLRDILHEFLMDGSSTERLLGGPLASLSARALACRSLALIDEKEFADCITISRIADEFHRSACASFAGEAVTSLCRQLHFRDRRHSPPNSAAQEQFRSAVSSLLEKLANRAFYIGCEKRTRRRWPD
jgi:hypothetical protein